MQGSASIAEAIALLNAEQNEQALETIESLLEVKKGIHGLRYAKAMALCRLGHYGKASDCLEALLQLEPAHAKARILLEALREVPKVGPKALIPQVEATPIEQSKVNHHIDQAILELAKGDHKTAYQFALKAKEDNERLKDLEYVIAICLLQEEKLKEALDCLQTELKYFPENTEARELMQQVAQQMQESGFEASPSVTKQESVQIQAQTKAEKTEKKYIVMFASPEFEHARYIFAPVFDFLCQNDEVELTMFSCKGKEGLENENYELGPCKVDRKPNAVMIFRPWWGADNELGLAAQQQNIPVIMLNHGAMFVHNENQKHKKSIYPADVGCLWGKHDLDEWRKWGNQDMFIVTGNPSYDPANHKPNRPSGLPEKYALYLSSAQGFQKDILFESAKELNKLMPVVVKAHPLEPCLDEMRQTFPAVFTEPELLVDLMYYAELIVSNVSSAFIPALYWGKPIFIHNFDQDFYHFSDFKKAYPNCFNYKSSAEWDQSMIDNALRPSKNDYQVFGHKADGENARRVAEVILSYMK